MSLLTEFPSNYHKPEPISKSFDMIVRDWSRQQFGGEEVVEEIRKALNTGVTQYGTYNQGGTLSGSTWSGGTVGAYGSGTVGAITPGSFSPGEASALRLENLDNTMTSVLATAEHLKIFRFLNKEPSKQPFYQWNRRESYGSTRGFFGFQEGLAPMGGRGQWSRNGTYVKFLGTRGGVTHPAVLTNILGGMSVDPVAEDQLGRTMDFMQRIERAIMYGDEDIADNNGTDSNYDGLVKLLTKQREKNIIDLKGLPLTMDTIANTASKLVSEGKLLSFNDITLFMSPQSIEDFGKMRYQTVLNNGTFGGPGTTVDRADLTSSARTNLIAGLSIVGQATSFGVIPFEWSIFTEPVEGNVPLFSADPGAPTAPSAGNLTAGYAANWGFIDNTSTTGTGWHAGSKKDWSASAIAVKLCANGSGKSNFSSSAYSSTDTPFWQYRISSVNDAGESLASFVVNSGASVQPTSDNEVRIRWKRVAGARAYRVYRCRVASLTADAPLADAVGGPYVAAGAYRWQYVGYVADPSGPNPSSGTVHSEPSHSVYVQSPAADNVLFIDRNGTPELYNNFYGGATIAPLICRNSADLCIAQMSPLLKMPLAPVNTTFEYLLLLYHTLVLKSPERQFIFKNVGPLV